MKNLTEKIMIMAMVMLVISCSPKYTANFQQKEHKFNRLEKLQTMAIQLTETQKVSDETLDEIDSEQFLASGNNDQVQEMTTSIERKIQSHKEKVEAIESNAELTVKEVRREWKKEERLLRKELVKEVKEAQKKGDEYVLMMILAFLIPFLGVGLTYGITNEFWISLLLTLLFWLPGAIYSMIKVHEHFRG
jgi:uncharacterized membrane protein YqaE (UPF0057 family)